MMQQHEEGLFLSHTSTHVRLSFNLTSAGIQENRTRSHCIFVAFSRRISDSNEMLSTSCYYNDHFARCHSVFFHFYFYSSCTKKMILAFNANIHTITNVNLTLQHLTFVSFFSIPSLFRWECNQSEIERKVAQIHSIITMKTNLRANKKKC